MNGVSGQGAFDAAVAGASLLPQAMSISDMVIGSSTCFIDELRITASPARHRTAADCRRRCCPAQRQHSVAGAWSADREPSRRRGKTAEDRKSVVTGKSGYIRVDLGGR